MTSFRYEAVDATGRRRRGVISADTQRRARRDIQASGLTPVSITSIREAETQALSRPRGRRPRMSEVIAATRQLATLIDSSTTVEESLNAVSAQMKGSPIAEMLLGLRTRIIEGWKLSDAMAEHPKTFSPLYRGIIAAGEASGNLGPIMLRLADMLEKNRAMSQRAVSALIYPAVTILVATGVVIALMNFVVPKIVDQFADTGARLPFLTQVVIATSDFVRAWGLLLLVLMFAGGIGIWRARRQENLRRRMDKALLRLPVIGRLSRELDAARFARTLSTLVASGTPLLDGLRAARRTVTNAHIEDRLDVTLTSVREGASLSVGIRRADVFPPMMASMVAAGERSGQLATLLERTAHQMETGFEAAVTIALRLLEPSIIVILGGVVLVIVLAIMLPLLQINTMAV